LWGEDGRQLKAEFARTPSSKLSSTRSYVSTPSPDPKLQALHLFARYQAPVEAELGRDRHENSAVT
jgi:hypothetical protein